MKKYCAALFSIVLVSLAQLLMKWGVSLLPAPPQGFTPQAGAIFNLIASTWAAAPLPLMAIAGGIFCYALSLLCWIIALKTLPLTKAYPLLSLSYIIVFLAAIPLFAESLSVTKSAGLACIIVGVWLASGGRGRGTLRGAPPGTSHPS